jgi:hypothetical protein
MTPKEKAKELVDKFYTYADDNYADDKNPYFGQILANKRIVHKNSTKQCALIAVDEILNALMYPPQLNEYRQVIHIKVLLYYKEVKQEIEKL